MPKAKSIYDMLRIRAHNSALLESIQPNLGTAIGFKKVYGKSLSQEPALLFFVPHKIHPKWLNQSDILPSRLYGPDNLWCITDVVEGYQTGEQPTRKIESPLTERLRGWSEKITPGSQISSLQPENDEYVVGTIGCFVRHRKTGRVSALSNSHVCGKKGTAVFHPSPNGQLLGKTSYSADYLEDQLWYDNVDEPSALVRIDAALVDLNISIDDLCCGVPGIGSIGAIEYNLMDNLSLVGAPVIKCGRTTGVSRGRICAFGYEYRNYNGAKVYSDLLIADAESGVPFSQSGDSGSLVLTDDGKFSPIAMLWGGEDAKRRKYHQQENWSYAALLPRILDRLDVDIAHYL